MVEAANKMTEDIAMRAFINLLNAIRAECCTSLKEHAARGELLDTTSIRRTEHLTYACS